MVVTGGAGFLGSHLCERLLSLGHRVCCVDNLVTGSRENIRHLEDNADFLFLYHDVSAPMELEGPVDVVLHLASPASPRAFFRLPIETLKAGSLGTLHALEIAVKSRARFVLASTSEVYGDAEVHPQPENYRGNVNPVGRRSVYDEAKRFAEALSTAYHREQGLDVRVARIFNTYGPRLLPEDGRVVSNFILQALRGQNLTVYGDGQQTRSLCYVSDTVEGLVRLTLAKAETMEAPRPQGLDGIHGPLNLGNPSQLKIIALARLILTLTGSSSGIEYLPVPPDDPRLRCPDITRARQLLGWEPQVPLEEGLQTTIGYFRSLLKLETRLPRPGSSAPARR